MPAQRVTLQPVAHHPIQPLETLAHVGSSRRQIDPRRRSKAEHRLQPLQHIHQSRQRRRIKAGANFDSAARADNDRQNTARVLSLVWVSPRSVPPRPGRRQHLRSQLPFVSSDNDSECSAPLRACGKTHSASSRSQQTLLPTAGSPMNCAVDAVPEPALRSCHNFITAAGNKTGALLSRLRTTSNGATKMGANCDDTFVAGSWSEPTHGSASSADCWFVMSICSPRTVPSSISLASGSLSRDVLETRSSVLSH